jgi:hypothetical protein
LDILKSLKIFIYVKLTGFHELNFQILILNELFIDKFLPMPKIVFILKLSSVSKVGAQITLLNLSELFWMSGVKIFLVARPRCVDLYTIIFWLIVNY